MPITSDRLRALVEECEDMRAVLTTLREDIMRELGNEQHDANMRLTFIAVLLTQTNIPRSPSTERERAHLARTAQHNERKRAYMREKRAKGKGTR